MKLVTLLILVCSCFLFVLSVATAQTTPSTSVLPCELANDSCAHCLKNVSCLWCNNPKKCVVYPVKNVLPSGDLCGLSAARWGVCWLNFEAMIISVSIIGGVLLIAITLCVCKCCGCCCFGRNDAKYQAEEMRLERERQERSMRQDERKQERMRKNDDIRRKYGLGTSGNQTQYKQFHNEEYNVNTS